MTHAPCCPSLNRRNHHHHKKMVIFRLMLISSFALHTQSYSTRLGARHLFSSPKSMAMWTQSLYGKASSTTTSHTRINMSSSASIEIASNLQSVQDRITKCVHECNRPEGSVKLVAVSKTKPVELLMDAYNVSNRYIHALTMSVDSFIHSFIHLIPCCIQNTCFVPIFANIGWTASLW